MEGDLFCSNRPQWPLKMEEEEEELINIIYV